MRIDEIEWPNRDRWIDIAWVLFSIANLVGMFAFRSWETVPFHFIWVSLTLLYGFRVWHLRPTLGVLTAVMIATAALILIDVRSGDQPLDELTEVPLMAAMFLAMVWHARRHLAATAEIERISETNARLLEREQRFVQDASHELRTPITVALGHAELIQRTAGDPVIAEDAGVIADELMRLRRVADRLLLLAGTEHPEFLNPRLMRLDAMVMDAERRWNATPRDWRWSTADDAAALVDPERFGVALDALIENAVNHTTEDDAIEVGVSRRGIEIVASVRDAGTGIPAADLDRIFDRFARADPGRSRHTGGAGLGLPIVRAIAEAHGGTVHVRSAVGVGTTFEIRIPAIGVDGTTSMGDPAFVARPADDRVVVAEDDAGLEEPVGRRPVP